MEQYEQLPEDASGAGYSKEKQEGNVHGYEQEEVEEKGEAVGKTDIVKGDSKSKKDEIEEVQVQVVDYERGKELSGERQRVDIEVYTYGIKDSMFGKSQIMKLWVKAWVSKSKVYNFIFDEVDVYLFEKKVNDYIERMIRINESIIAIGYEAKIDLKVNSVFKIRKL